MSARRALPLLLGAMVVSACGAKRFSPPVGAGVPFAEYGSAFEQATAECRNVKTITATLSLSGRAGGQKLRGQVDAGFSAPSEARLEGRAPFGRPVFVLVARDETSATLVLPRDNRVLGNAPPAAIVEALAGVALAPGELRAAIAGCGFGGSAADGRLYGDWLAVDTPGATHHLRRQGGRWRLVVSIRGPLAIEYRDFNATGRPATVRIRTTAAADDSATDMTLRLSDVSTNVTLGPEVFALEVPEGADPLTLEELRRAGPLGAAQPPK